MGGVDGQKKPPTSSQGRGLFHGIVPGRLSEAEGGDEGFLAENGTSPDAAAQAAHDAGRLAEPTVDAFWDAVRGDVSAVTQWKEREKARVDAETAHAARWGAERFRKDLAALADRDAQGRLAIGGGYLDDWSVRAQDAFNRGLRTEAQIAEGLGIPYGAWMTHHPLGGRGEDTITGVVGEDGRDIRASDLLDLSHEWHHVGRRFDEALFLDPNDFPDVRTPADIDDKQTAALFFYYTRMREAPREVNRASLTAEERDALTQRERPVWEAFARTVAPARDAFVRAIAAEAEPDTLRPLAEAYANAMRAHKRLADDATKQFLASIGKPRAYLNERPHRAGCVRYAVGSVDGALPTRTPLVAMHFLSSKHLAAAIKRKGLPTPSIAVTRDNATWQLPNSYGDSALFFKQGTVDPKANPRNLLFPGDAMTQRYPQNAVKKGGLDNIMRTLANMGWEKLDEAEVRKEALILALLQNDRETAEDIETPALFAAWVYGQTGEKLTTPEAVRAYTERFRDAETGAIEPIIETTDNWGGVYQRNFFKDAPRHIVYTGRAPTGAKAAQEAFDATGVKFRPGAYPIDDQSARRNLAYAALFTLGDIENARTAIANATKRPYEDWKQAPMRLLDAVAKDGVPRDVSLRKFINDLAKETTLDGALALFNGENRWYNTTPEARQALLDLVQFYKDAERDYYEAKPRRIVDTDEIALALIPASEITLRRELENHGIPYETYNASSTHALEETSDVAQNAIARARFQIGGNAPRTPIAIPNEYMTAKEAKTILDAQRGKVFVNQDDGREAKFGGNQINKMLGRKATDKSLANGFSMSQHNQAVARVGELYESATLIEERPDKDDDPNIVAIRRYVSPIAFGEKEASAYITIKESEQNGNRIYSLEVLELEDSRLSIGGLTSDQHRHARESTDTVAYPGVDVNPRRSIGGLYSGAPVAYDRPSLKAVGSNTGSLAYGWGLYATTYKYAAMSYAQDALHEQVWWINRPEGDESHLLVWDEPISQENRERWLAAINSLGLDPRELAHFSYGEDWATHEMTGRQAYDFVEAIARYIIENAHPKQFASTLLARFDIDGMKYGNTYVAFSDEHLRVVRRWVWDPQTQDFVLDPTLLPPAPRRSIIGYGPETKTREGELAEPFTADSRNRFWDHLIAYAARRRQKNILTGKTMAEAMDFHDFPNWDFVFPNWEPFVTPLDTDYRSNENALLRLMANTSALDLAAGATILGLDPSRALRALAAHAREVLDASEGYWRLRLARLDAQDLALRRATWEDHQRTAANLAAIADSLERLAGDYEGAPTTEYGETLRGPLSIPRGLPTLTLKEDLPPLARSLLARTLYGQLTLGDAPVAIRRAPPTAVQAPPAYTEWRRNRGQPTATPEAPRTTLQRIAEANSPSALTQLAHDLDGSTLTWTWGEGSGEVTHTSPSGTPWTHAERGPDFRTRLINATQDHLRATYQTAARFSIGGRAPRGVPLTAYHALSQEQLLRSLRQGGLVAPSIAVTEAGKARAFGYGECILFFRREAVDPQANPENFIFPGDAGTPIYPRRWPTQTSVDAVLRRVRALGPEWTATTREEILREAMRVYNVTNESFEDSGLVDVPNALYALYLAESSDGDITPTPDGTRDIARDLAREDPDGFLRVPDFWRWAKAQFKISTRALTPRQATRLMRLAPLKELSSLSPELGDEMTQFHDSAMLALRDIEETRKVIVHPHNVERGFDALKRAIRKPGVSAENSLRHLSADLSLVNTEAELRDLFSRENEWYATGERALNALLRYIRNASGMEEGSYFEAKPMRLVGLDEIRMALLPQNASAELRAALTESGIPHKTYTEGDRRRAILDTAAQTRFSIGGSARYARADFVARATPIANDPSVKEADVRLFPIGDVPDALVRHGATPGGLITFDGKVAKMARRHDLPPERLAAAIEAMNDPVAIFLEWEDTARGRIGLSVLTDVLADDGEGRQAPVRLTLISRTDAAGMLITSAYARTKKAEAYYQKVVANGGLIYLDEQRASQLPMEAETQCSLETSNVRGGPSTGTVPNREEEVKENVRRAIGGVERARRVGAAAALYYGRSPAVADVATAAIVELALLAEADRSGKRYSTQDIKDAYADFGIHADDLWRRLGGSLDVD